MVEADIFRKAEGPTPEIVYPVATTDHFFPRLEHGDTECVFCLADIVFIQGDVTRAYTLLEEAVALARAVGNWWSLGRRLVRLGQVAQAQAALENLLGEWEKTVV